MAYVVAEPCIKCKYTDCLDGCPVDCFYEGQNMLVINPEECIDCGLCLGQCPINAIYTAEDLPVKWAHYKDINAQYSKLWPQITAKKDPLPEAAEFSKIEDKAAFLDPSPAS